MSAVKDESNITCTYMYILRLMDTITAKNEEIKLRENDLRESLTRHEREIQRLVSKGDVDIQVPEQYSCTLSKCMNCLYFDKKWFGNEYVVNSFY